MICSEDDPQLVSTADYRTDALKLKRLFSRGGGKHGLYPEQRRGARRIKTPLPFGRGAIPFRGFLDSDKIVEKVAKAGFNREHTSLVKPEMAGLVWKGKPLEVGERLPADEWHFVKHVLARQEWPEGMSLDDYLESLRAVIQSSESGIMISKSQGIYRQIAFVADSGQWRGVGGSDFILVEYRDGYGFRITGFQPVDLQRQLHVHRSDIRWLRKMK